jgi:MSHA biogenesis protein MshQ
MKNQSLQSLKAIAISLLFTVPIEGMAVTCLDVFPKVLSSSVNNGKVRFEQEVRIEGTSGTIDISIEQDQTSGSALSCISQQCEDSGIRANALTLPNFQKSSSNQDEKADNGESLNIPQGSYHKVEAKYQASIRFTQNSQDTFIEELKADESSTITFDGGVYWIEKIDLKYRANIVINGNDKVILITKEKDLINNEVSYNVNGTPNQLVIVAYEDVKFGYKTSLKGFIYADKKIELENDSAFEGAIHSDDIKFKYKASINDARSTIESANFNGLCTVSPTSGLSGNLNVDNTFEAYLSTDDSVQGVLLSSGNNWQTTYTLLSQLTPGQDYYLHVKAENTGGPAGFLSDFEITGTEHVFSNGLTTLTTNTTEWMVSTIGWNNYQTPNSYGSNESGPWAIRSSVDANAEWIWSSNSNDNDTYFSTHIVVPSLVPLLDYRFDECSLNGLSGDIVDQTGNFDGGSNGVPANLDDAVINKSLDLSATDISDWINVPSSVIDGIDDFSIAVWFKTSVTKGQQEILHALGSNVNDDELEIFLKDSHVVYVKVRGSSEELLSTINLTDDNWHHMVLTRVGQDVCLFIDGAQQECKQGVNSGILSVINPDAVVIGQEQDAFGGGFNDAQSFVGQLDEFKIFSKKIADIQIYNMYQNELTGNNYDASLRDAVHCGNICYATPGELNAVGIRIDSSNEANVSRITSTSQALEIHAAWLAAGSPASGLIDTGRYNVAASGSSTADRIDFGGSPRNFAGTLPYPGIAGVGDQSYSDFLVHTSGTMSLEAGEYTIFVESDDGFSFVMDTLSGDTVSFIKFGKSSAGAANELRFEGQTGNTSSGGSFTLSQYSVFDIAAVFFERGGGDFLEVSIINDTITSDTATDYEILRNDAMSGKVKFGQCASPAPLLEYRFDEQIWTGGTGEIIDNTGNGFNAQVNTNSTPQTTDPALSGNPGTCGYASQNDGSIQISGLPLDTTTVGVKTTVTFWMKWDGTENVMPIGWNRHDIWLLNGAMGFNTFNSDLYGISSASLRDQWRHVAVEFTNGSVINNRIYIDGQLQTLSQILGTPAKSDAFVNSQMRVGGVVSNTNYNFHGLLDEFRVYEGALSTAQISTIMAETHTCAAPVVHHYEIIHDGQGLTCDEETVTVRACADANCINESTESVTLDFLVDGAVTGSDNFIGNTPFSFNNTDAETVTLSLGNTSIAASSPLECNAGSSSSCDMVFTDAGFRFLSGVNETTVPNQIAGAVFGETLKIQAVKDIEGVCTSLFDGNKNVNLSQENVAPGGDSGLSFSVDGGPIAKHTIGTTSTTLDFDSQGIAIIPTPIYNDAGQIRLHASYNAGEVSLAGSSNSFWVSPAKFVVTAKSGATDLNGATATATTTFAAGDDFNLTVMAYNAAIPAMITPNYSPGKIELMLTRTGPSLTDGVDGNLTYALGNVLLSSPNNTANGVNPSFQQVTLSNFVSGVSSYSAARYSEVGLINLDVQDSNYGGANIVVSASAINIGRFIPKYFTQTVADNGAFFAACNVTTAFANAAYSGQMEEATNTIGAISYLTNPVLEITARNSQGETTQNYFNDYMKLTNSDIIVNTPTFDQMAKGVDSNPLPLTANMNTGTLSQYNMTATSSGNALPRGVLHYQLSAADNFFYQRSANALVAAFTSDIDFSIATIIDTDTVQVNRNPSVDQLPVTASPIGVEIRFGRLLLENSFGPETSNFPQLMQIEHFDGTTFIVSSDESCASYDEGRVSLTNISLDPSHTSVLGGVGTFSNGKTQIIELQAPGTGNQGQIGVLYDAYDWFKYDWDNDGAYDESPEAVATFGIYRGNDRTIHWREVFND